MFNEAYEQLTLATSILNYIGRNNKVDVAVIKKMIDDNKLDDKSKLSIVLFLEDYLFDHDINNFAGNLELFCDLINEKAD